MRKKNKKTLIISFEVIVQPSNHTFKFALFFNFIALCGRQEVCPVSDALDSSDVVGEEKSGSGINISGTSPLGFGGFRDFFKVQFRIG